MKIRAPAESAQLAEPFWLRDWCVHASTHQLNKGDTTQKLEPRTMAVLVYLAERAGQAVSREQPGGRMSGAVWSLVTTPSVTASPSCARHSGMTRANRSSSRPSQKSVTD